MLRGTKSTETGRSIYQFMCRQLISIDSPCKVVHISLVTTLLTSDFDLLKDTCKAMDQAIIGDNFPSFRCLRLDQRAFDYFTNLKPRGILKVSEASS